MHPSRRFQEFHTDKNIFPPQPSTSSGHPVGQSPSAVIGCGLARGPNDKLNGLCGNTLNNVVNGVASNQPEEPLNSRFSNENGYWDLNNLLAPWQPSEKNLQETSGNAIYPSSLGKLQYVKWEEPSLAKVLTVMPPLQGHTNQLKACESNEITEKSQNEGQVQDFSRYGQSGCLNSNLNASGEIRKPSSNLPMLVENLQNRSLDPRMLSVGVEGQVCFQESSNIQAESGAYRGLDSSNISIAGRTLPEFHKEQVNDIFAQNQLQISSGCPGGFLTNNAVKDDTKIEKTLSSAAPSLIPPLNGEASTKKVETDLSICGNDQKSKALTSSIKTDEIEGCKASEKLWNGTLQLSSSVKLSAAAYFRRFRFLTAIYYWLDSVEVKGKVRLEAFEKYIQDLPRSRSRGLMVISLCLREGFSKEGLKVMNEEIKKYKTGKRVGRAQLSPGVDIYICPNIEPIITILSKNGFSKGLVSVQDHQDSLIGCAVWRKNSSSDPNPQQVTESGSSSAKAEAKAPATYGVVGNNSGESKNADSSSSSPSDIHAIHSIVKQLTEIEASIFRSLGVEKPQGNLQLLSTILPSASEDVKQSDPPTEDDDLPEYDFGAAIPHGLKNDLVAPSQMCVETQKNVYGVSLPQKRKPQIVDLEMSKLPIQEQANKTRNLFDEDDMPEWQPPDIKHFKPPTDFRPPQHDVALPPQPPLRPPPFRPAGRPQHMPFNTREPNNHNGWRRR